MEWAWNTESQDIPEQGRVSGGVKGILLATDDVVVSANQVQKGQNIVLVSKHSPCKTNELIRSRC